MRDELIASAALYALAVGLGLMSIAFDDGGIAFLGLMPAFMGAMMLDQCLDMMRFGL